MGGDEELQGLEAIGERAEPRFLVISLLQSLVQLPNQLVGGGDDVGSEIGLAAKHFSGSQPADGNVTQGLILSAI